MREEYMSLIAAVVLWILFTPVNELASASNADGCCKTGGCGNSVLARALWWGNLAAAILFTLYFLYQLYEEYGSDTLKKFVK